MGINELNEFKGQLNTMKVSLESNISRLREELEAVVTDDNINDMEDLASLESESMYHNSLLTQQQHELGEVLHALNKIENGTYGVCEETGEAISVERLHAEPHARYCIKHAQ